jgi:phosphomannomutase
MMAQTYLLEDLVPTPFVAFAVPQLGCAGMRDVSFTMIGG